ncbi:MAG: right-handed parallel beta-helix repeat-containing protein [Candidatus Thorarchaeota archaeon]
MKRMSRITTFLLLQLFFTSVLISAPVNLVSNSNTPSEKSKVLSQVNELTINGNADLLTKAESNYWPGTGTEDDPIRIEGLYFSGANNMFVISHTDLYFIFCNNTLDGIRNEACAIVVWEARNGIFMDNEIYSASVGIHVWGANDTIITRNTIYDSSWDAVFIEDASYRNTISHNLFYNNHEAGVAIIDSSSENEVIHNEIFDCGYGVVVGDRSNSCIIEDNYIHDCVWGGVLTGSEYHIIQQNHINGTSGSAIRIKGFNNTIRDNLIADNPDDGCILNIESGNTTVCNNVFLNSTDYGLKVLSNYNIITENDFIENGASTQALDDGTNNTFNGNHWSDWISPDSDSDQIVDIPYNITGTAESIDAIPQVGQINSHGSWIPIDFPEDNLSDTSDFLLAVTLGIGVIATVVLVFIFIKYRRNV